MDKMQEAIILLEDDRIRIDFFKKIFYGSILLVYTNANYLIYDFKSKKFEQYSGISMYLDHDLGGEIYVDEKNTNTGSEVVRYLSTCFNEHNIFNIIVHSMNTVAANNMVIDLERAGYFVGYMPYSMLRSAITITEVKDVN